MFAVWLDAWSLAKLILLCFWLPRKAIDKNNIIFLPTVSNHFWEISLFNEVIPLFSNFPTYFLLSPTTYWYEWLKAFWWSKCEPTSSPTSHQCVMANWKKYHTTEIQHHQPTVCLTYMFSDRVTLSTSSSRVKSAKSTDACSGCSGSVQCMVVLAVLQYRKNMTFPRPRHLIRIMTLCAKAIHFAFTVNIP